MRNSHFGFRQTQAEFMHHVACCRHTEFLQRQFHPRISQLRSQVVFLHETDQMLV